MKNEEAIEEIKRFYPPRDLDDYTKLRKALDLSIEALEKPEEQRWIPIDEQLPDPDELILLSFENFGGVMIGRYTVDDDDAGTFRVGDMDESFIEHDFYVNAWCKLPEPYKAKEGMKPNKRGYIYYCAKCGCDVGSYGLASGKIHKDTKCRKCGTVVDWE